MDQVIILIIGIFFGAFFTWLIPKIESNRKEEKVGRYIYWEIQSLMYKLEPALRSPNDISFQKPSNRTDIGIRVYPSKGVILPALGNEILHLPNECQRSILKFYAVYSTFYEAFSRTQNPDDAYLLLQDYSKRLPEAASEATKCICKCVPIAKI